MQRSGHHPPFGAHRGVPRTMVCFHPNAKSSTLISSRTFTFTGGLSQFHLLRASRRPYLYTSPSSVMPNDSVNEHRSFANFTSPSDVVSTLCGSRCIRSDSSARPRCCSVRAVSVSSSPSRYSPPASSRYVMWNCPLANSFTGCGSGTGRG